MQEENNLNKSFQEIFENIKNDVTKTQLEIMINANANLVIVSRGSGKIEDEYITGLLKEEWIH